jgi:hypothetical protein
MALFCLHDDKAVKVLRGESLIHSTFAIAFWCTKCGRQRLDKGYSESRAYEKLKWLQEHGR